MPLIDTINEDIKNAMRNRQQIRLDTLRMLKSKILTVDARGNIPDNEVVKLFKTYAGNLQEALEQAQANGRDEAAEKLKSELEVVNEYLPAMLSPEQAKAVILDAIQESGAKTKKDFGLVMKVLKKNNQPIDGKIAKDLAVELLDD